MAESESGLIDAYLAELARQLPRGDADELADGLIETYEHCLAAGLPPAAAARAAVERFGDCDRVLTAFARQGAPRRAARTLIAVGPLVGFCWLLVLIAGRAWTWPVPVLAPLAVGVVLAVAIASLVGAARARRVRFGRRAGIVGCLGVMIMDAALMGAAVLVMPTLSWPICLAVPASAARLLYAADALHDMRATARNA
ncbi:MAG TPA: permease prefix domain 1-containing protein [Actinocrinis sp.]|nr:permease prefix domain 1-containing protein [Actinocrinis sp.]